MSKFIQAIVLSILIYPQCARSEAPIELEQDMEGVRIEVRTGWIGGVAYARLVNRSPSTALCEANFRNGPESKRRRARLEPEEERTLTFQPAREVVRLRIHIRCEPAGPDER